MNIVTYDEYNDEKQQFFIRHKNEFKLEQEGNSAVYYTKTYIFDDGAVWYEVSRYQELSEEVEIRKCIVVVTEEFMETEYWSNEDSISKYWYEKWTIDH